MSGETSDFRRRPEWLGPLNEDEKELEFTGFTTRKEVPSGDEREIPFTDLVHEMLLDFVKKGGDPSLPYEIVREGEYIIIRQERRVNEG
jgi:hypothetical protein